MIEFGWKNKNRRILSIKTSDSRNTTWKNITRVCSSRAYSTDSWKHDEITIELIQYMSCHSEVSKFITTSKIEYSIVKSLELAIVGFNSAESEYIETEGAEPVSPELVQKTLSERGFHRILSKDQMKNVSKLVSIPSGATFSVPGAGKTTEALAFFFFSKEVDEKLLVIAPKNAFAAWEEEIIECFTDSNNKISKKFDFVRLTGGSVRIEKLLKKQPGFMLINYHQLASKTNDEAKVLDEISNYLANNNVSIFVDESHRMKGGENGEHGRSVLALSDLSNKKLVMSGTPMPQGPSDLVGQFRFLYPAVPNVNENNVVNLFQERFVRTTKSDMDLPEPIREYKKLSMKPAQSALYDMVCSESALTSAKLNKIITRSESRYIREMRRIVIRLIQIASNPALLLTSETFDHNFDEALLSDSLAEGDSPKIEYACKRALELASKGEKVIIWTNFVHNVETIASRLQVLNSVFVHGGVETGDLSEDDSRESKINKFKTDPDCMVLVANPAACGESISLHKCCHTAIYVDRNFNAAHYMQSEDRIHRFGLPEVNGKPVDTNIEILVHDYTIDAKINLSLFHKINNMKEALNDERLMTEPFESDDIFDLDDASFILEHLRENRA